MKSLSELKNDISRQAYGMIPAEAIAKGICISCHKPPTFSTEAGRREYKISGMCEPCFDKLAEGDCHGFCDGH